MKSINHKIILTVMMLSGIYITGCGGGGGQSPATSSAELSKAPELVQRAAACHHQQNTTPAQQAEISFKDIMRDIQTTPVCAFIGHRPDMKRRNALNVMDDAKRFYFKAQFKQAANKLRTHFMKDEKLNDCSGDVDLLKLKIEFLIKFIEHNGFESLVVAANPAELYVGETSALSAMLTYKDGYKEEIGQYVTWKLSTTDVGTVSGTTFAATTVGGTQVTASLFTWLTSAQVTIYVKEVVVVDPDPPADDDTSDDTTSGDTGTPDDGDTTTVTPFVCGDATSITAPTGWGIYPDSIVAFESVPGDKINWGRPIVYIEYDYLGVLTNYLLDTEPSPTGCLIAEGNPQSMLNAAIITVNTNHGSLGVYFPDLTTRAQNSNMAVYVAKDGSTYWARSDNYTTSLADTAPDLTYWQALTPEHLARAGH